MAGEVKSQGTHLYFVDRTGPATLVKLTCPTGITGLTGGAADQIESTCLDETTDKTFVRGLNSPVAISVPFNLHPADASHQLLYELKESGDVLDWAALLSDGTAPPTLGLTPDFDLLMPTTRSGFQFQGYIAEVNIDATGNDLIRGTLTIQRTGPAIPSWKA
jgi:hypothetical protein